jgi:hypothetical protein
MTCFYPSGGRKIELTGEQNVTRGFSRNLSWIDIFLGQVKALGKDFEWRS